MGTFDALLADPVFDKEDLVVGRSEDGRVTWLRPDGMFELVDGDWVELLDNDDVVNAMEAPDLPAAEIASMRSAGILPQ